MLTRGGRSPAGSRAVQMSDSKGRCISKNCEIAYADFVPKFITSSSIEPFDSVIARVNEWMKLCEQDVKVLNIETVLCPLDALRSNNNAQAKSLQSSSASGSSTMAEFVRVWIDASYGFPADWPGRIISTHVQLPSK